MLVNLWFSLIALRRVFTLCLLYPLLEYGTYDNPENVMGYTGWYRLRGTKSRWGCVAFTHQDTGLQFRW